MDAKDGPSRTFSYDENFRKRLVSDRWVLWLFFVLCIAFDLLFLALFWPRPDINGFVLLSFFVPGAALYYFLLKSNRRALRAYGGSLLITDQSIIYRAKDGHETRARWPDIAFIKEKLLYLESELIDQAGNVLLTFVGDFKEAPALHAMIEENLLQCNAPCTRVRVFHNRSYRLVVLCCYLALIAVFGIFDGPTRGFVLSVCLFVLSLFVLLFTPLKVFIKDDRFILISLCRRQTILFDNIIGSPTFIITAVKGFRRLSVYIQRTGSSKLQLGGFQEGTIMIGAALERALRDFREKKARHENLSV